MMTKRSFDILFLALLGIFLTSCSSGFVSSPTLTLVPTIELPPTLTPFLPPTFTPLPSSTATPLPSPTFTPEPTFTPTPPPAVLVGAGDISYCGETNLGDEMTSDLFLKFPDAAIFTAGDNVYGDGTRAELANCFDPSWGRFKDRIHPSPGNHDYMTEAGAPYYEYFGPAAGEAGLGYYSYDLGSWHIIALNSNCNNVACGPDGMQYTWLREDLQANADKCTLLYWHHPRFSSGIAGGSASVKSFWRTAFELGGDVVVNGHDHDYERFAPMDGEGNADSNGVRLFIVGTGGATLRDFGEIKPNSEARYNDSHGVIKFTLYPGRYEWEFIPVVPGDFSDTGSGECR